MVGVHSAPPLVGVAPELALPVHAWRKGPTPTRRSSSSVGVHSTLWIPTSRWVSRPAPVCGRPCRMVATSIPRSMGVLYTPPSHRITPMGVQSARLALRPTTPWWVSFTPPSSHPLHTPGCPSHPPRSPWWMSFAPLCPIPSRGCPAPIGGCPAPIPLPADKKKAPPEAGLWCWLGD